MTAQQVKLMIPGPVGVEEEVLAAMGEPVRKTKAHLRGVKQDRFGVLKGAEIPAVVVEAGFFSHRKEGWKLLEADYQEKIARGIVSGIIAFDRRTGR